jgi:hypothetical protein
MPAGRSRYPEVAEEPLEPCSAEADLMLWATNGALLNRLDDGL